MQKILILSLCLISLNLNAQALKKTVLGSTVSKDLEEQIKDPEINKRAKAFDMP